MGKSFVLASGSDFIPELEDNVMDSIFKQYEHVIVESLITSFGLDFLVKDQHGGDVDTIHNVRQVGKDPEMQYKNKTNLENYNNRGEYNSSAYHGHDQYIAKNREVKEKKDAETLRDAYTGEKILPGQKSDLDHVISAKEIHDDPGRVLAGLDGTDLANSDVNLQTTNPHTNRSKKADSMDQYLDKKGDEYTEKQKENMRKKDAEARKAYERKLAKTYYTSPRFAKDVTLAAGSVGMKMGARQAIGFIFSEIWFAVKAEFGKISGTFDFGNLLSAIGNGVKTGFENAKHKYKELFVKFKEGAFAGALASLTTTLCNIFFTTAKNVVKIIRQSYASLVQAVKVLFLNPDGLPFGERMRAVVKILATGASVITGGIVMDMVNKTGIGAIPGVGDCVSTFCGSLVTGIMSCTLLYFLDRSEIVNKLVNALNSISSITFDLNYYHKQAAELERYAAELMNIDIDTFRKETESYEALANAIESETDEQKLNALLKQMTEELGIKIPWEGDFDDFMMSKDSQLVFG